MGTIHFVFGPQGAGKSTYSLQLAQETRAVRFSIDEWMQRLFGPDLPQPLNPAWIMERVRRCEAQIWAVASQVALTGGQVVLDLGFMKLASREEFRTLAAQLGVPVKTYFLDAPYAVRKERVLARNVRKDGGFSFEVTAPMFDFMEQQFERPSAQELAGATVIE